MDTVYEEENQIEDLNNEADRVIAMNPSGVIEKFSTNEKKYKCIGDTCVVLGDNEKESSNSYTKYIIYFIIFLVLCALGYFFYKKYKGCDS